VSILYSEKEVERVLATLRIKPDDNGLIDPHEAARILTWRALKEHKVVHVYVAASVLRFVDKGVLAVAEQKGERRRRYQSEDIFGLEIFPRRGLHRQEGVVEMKVR